MGKSPGTCLAHRERMATRIITQLNGLPIFSLVTLGTLCSRREGSILNPCTGSLCFLKNTFLKTSGQLNAWKLNNGSTELQKAVPFSESWKYYKILDHSCSFWQSLIVFCCLLNLIFFFYFAIKPTSNWLKSGEWLIEIRVFVCSILNGFHLCLNGIILTAF